jgi:hypothetical protein
MAQMIFVNLPVSDLPRSRAFFTGLGWSINEMFSDETAACIVVSETIFLMLLTHAKFGDFINRPLADPAKGTSVLLALNCDSREAVDAIAAKALGLGGSDNGKTQDLGFMYSRSLSDPDGNVFEFFWMDPAAAAGGPPPA